MKTATVVLIVFISFGGFSQDSIPKKKIGLIVKTDVVTPLLAISKQLGGCSVTIEKMFWKRHSLQLTGNYIFKNYYGDNKSQLLRQIKTLQIIPEYKFFVVKNYRNSCPYIGLYYKYGREEDIDSDWSSSRGLQKKWDYYLFSYSFGILNGYEIWIKNKWTLDFMYGHGARNIYHFKIIKSGYFPGYGLGWVGDNRFAINIGYKF